jgi:hypothetical protein
MVTVSVEEAEMGHALVPCCFFTIGVPIVSLSIIHITRHLSTYALIITQTLHTAACVL